MGKHRTGRERVDDVRERAVRAKGRADELVDRAQAARTSVPIVDILFRAGERDRDAGGGLIAAAIAFRVFLYLVPFVFVAVLVLGILPWTSDDPSTFFRSGGIASYLVGAINTTQEQSFIGWITASVVGSFALVWTAHSLLRTFNEASRFAWGIPYQRARHVVQNTGALLVWSVAMSVAAAFIAFLHGQAGSLMDIVLVVVGWVSYTALWMLLLTRFPRREGVPWYALVPGAAVFAFGFQVMEVFTAVWMSFKVDHAADRYGDLGTAVALLAWLAIMGRLAVGSSVINASLWDRSHPRPTEAVADETAAGPSPQS